MQPASSGPPCRAAHSRKDLIGDKGPGVRARLETFDLCSISWGVFPRHLLPLVALALLAAPPALAACTDPAGPEVVWRRCLLDGRDLSGANLAGAVLRDTSLQRARLVGANLTGADAFNARFVSSDLTDVDMSGATLREVDFTRAVLRNAKLAGADLRRARLFRADLTGADLTGANLEGADLSHTVLAGVRWTDGQRVCAAGSVGACQ
ncbi:pentapeptide repeat-containing protein [Falsiroseomonas bella]|uniref:Pentapeptide repeat-containing protein n=1 Tax=Falsiroseomonas bella TaxID=2184016 RepID=A0A317FMJ8_9PROT|nr:pentapeptide repeat-containing protein [Falsiroseomonas bella]